MISIDERIDVKSMPVDLCDYRKRKRLEFCGLRIFATFIGVVIIILEGVNLNKMIYGIGGHGRMLRVVVSQSVIQAANQQSVIQSPNQLGKGNLILVGKSNSVIQTAGGHTLQVVGDSENDFYEDDATKKRREILARRPSYRKILNDLAGDEKESLQNDEEEDNSAVINLASIAPSSRSGMTTISGSQYATSSGLLKVIPASAIHISGAQTNGLQAITMTSSSNDNHPTLVQYSQAQDGSQQFFVPDNMKITRDSDESLDAATLVRPEWVMIEEVFQNLLSSRNPGSTDGEWSDVAEPLLQKRELRLLKNREAARECRRKKKEYIKCLENRVAVLENQNKTLIEELKSLKELYCSQKEEMH
nr:EOG090X0DMT [Artemia franciscana]